MLEVEVLEVGTNKLQALGIGWPNSFSVGVVGAAGCPGRSPSANGRTAARHGRLTISIPARAHFRSTRPLEPARQSRIRVKNKEKARVHIGDKVPVITTTTTSTGRRRSVTYLDVV